MGTIGIGFLFIDSTDTVKLVFVAAIFCFKYQRMFNIWSLGIQNMSFPSNWSVWMVKIWIYLQNLYVAQMPAISNLVVIELHVLILVFFFNEIGASPLLLWRLCFFSLDLLVHYAIHCQLSALFYRFISVEYFPTYHEYSTMGWILIDILILNYIWYTDLS